MQLIINTFLFFLEVCIACESFDVTEQHPFFKGGLCESCKVRQ